MSPVAATVTDQTGTSSTPRVDGYQGGSGPGAPLTQVLTLTVSELRGPLETLWPNQANTGDLTGNRSCLHAYLSSTGSITQRYL